MLGADASSKAAAFGALAAYPGGLQLGGGVTADNAVQYLEAGASHVIVTSYVFREGRLEEERLANLVRAWGSGRRASAVCCW
jgi:phosphoribosylformimino-5-aminoimidazole carboxamide ribotide isomerase